MKVQLKDFAGNNLFPATLNGESGTVSAGSTRVIPTNAKVYITSELLTPDATTNTITPLTTSKNEVGDLDLRNVMLKFVSDTVNFEDAIIIAYQGNSSLQKPKKGFAIDFAEKHRFPGWLEMDSFHLKGYYSDWMHARDLCANRVIEQVYMTRPASVRRPYMINNDSSDSYANRADMDMLCHVDGFPIELYINDVYWGIYSVNIKKERDNYWLSKNNVNHVQIEAANDTYYTVPYFNTGGTGWRQVEIRNPKSDSGNTSFSEGVEPNAGEVKTAWQSFIAQLNAITTGTPKSTLEGFLNVPDWVDGILLTWFLNHADNWCKNALYTTWDATHWSPLLYDMDSSFGIMSTDGDAANPVNFNTHGLKAYSYCPWLSTIETILADDIKSRYAELRSMGVFNADNVVRLFEEWSTSVGYNAYKRDMARWTYPSNGGSSANFYDGIPRVGEWMTGRIAFLDQKFGYNV